MALCAPNPFIFSCVLLFPAFNSRNKNLNLSRESTGVKRNYISDKDKIANGFFNSVRNLDLLIEFTEVRLKRIYKKTFFMIFSTFVAHPASFFYAVEPQLATTQATENIWRVFPLSKTIFIEGLFILTKDKGSRRGALLRAVLNRSTLTFTLGSCNARKDCSPFGGP